MHTTCADDTFQLATLTIAKLGMEEVSDILNKAGFNEEVVKIFRVNKIDRSLIVALDKDDMKELGIVALGDSKKLQMLIATLQNMRKTDVRQATQTSSSTSSNLTLSQPGSVLHHRLH